MNTDVFSLRVTLAMNAVRLLVESEEPQRRRVLFPGVSWKHSWPRKFLTKLADRDLILKTGSGGAQQYSAMDANYLSALTRDDIAALMDPQSTSPTWRPLVRNPLDLIEIADANADADTSPVEPELEPDVGVLLAERIGQLTGAIVQVHEGQTALLARMDASDQKMTELQSQLETNRAILADHHVMLARDVKDGLLLFVNASEDRLMTHDQEIVRRLIKHDDDLGESIAKTAHEFATAIAHSLDVQTKGIRRETDIQTESIKDAMSTLLAFIQRIMLEVTGINTNPRSKLQALPSSICPQTIAPVWRKRR